MDLQAVVLAGGMGSRLFPLVHDTFPKCLLPVANRPLISFQLELLEKSGLTSVIIATNECYAPVLKLALDGFKGRLNIDLQVTKNGRS